MRQIKFRAWYKTDIENGEPLLFEWYINDMIAGVRMAKEKDCFYSLDCLFSSQSDWIIQQFIGLCDKNDQEIYEGDIIKTDDSNWGYGGEYDEKNDGYLYMVVPGIDELLADDGLVDSFFDFGVWHRCCEVIGNIHENPELVGEVV